MLTSAPIADDPRVRRVGNTLAAALRGMSTVEINQRRQAALAAARRRSWDAEAPPIIKAYENAVSDITTDF